MLAQNACVLTSKQVLTNHEASLTILEEVGLLVHNEAPCELLRRHGFCVDTETRIVRFPPAVVEQWRQAFPDSVERCLLK